MDSFKEIYNLNKICLHFDKKFQFSNFKFNHINLDNNLFDNKEWIINDFNLLEENLNRIKSKLNNYDLRKWSYSTNKFGLCNIYRCYNDFENEYLSLNSNDNQNISINISDYQNKPELFTRAWIKLYEILIQFNFKEILNDNLINFNDQINYLALCEAPGAFVTSINHFIKQNFHSKDIKFNWLATSLNPYYEYNNQYKDALIEDCFIESTFDNWYFGEDNSGNIQQAGFYQSLNNEFRKLINTSKHNEQENNLKINNSFKINLITADGGICNIEKPDLQELNSFSLILHEVIVALNCLADGGCFILKIFTFFNCRTISLIYLLVCVFKKLNLFKPITSKEGNSEIYLIGVDYQFKDNENLIKLITQRFNEFKNNNQINLINDTILFKQNIIPFTFIEQLIDCSNFFTNHQTHAINRNIYLFDKNDRRFFYNYKKMQKKIDEEFKKLINLKPIKIENQIVKKSNQIILEKEYYYFGLNRKLINDYYSLTSYNDLINELNNKDKKLIKIRKLINSIFKCSNNELIEYFNQFHTFNHTSIVNLDKIIIVDSNKIQYNNSYLNSKFCLEDLKKVLVDYESLNYSDNIVELNERIDYNRNMIKNQLIILIKLKLNEINKLDKKFYLNIIKNDKESNLSTIILESINQDINLTQLECIDNESNDLIIHLIDLNDENEYFLTNQLISELVNIIDQLKYNHLLIISLSSLFTRYLNSLIYILTCMYNQFTLIPFYLEKEQNLKSKLILLFTNKSDNQFNDQHNKIKNLLININNLNLNKDKQILDFIGIHNLKRNNKNYLKLIITANNFNLIEQIKLKMNL